MSEVVINKLGNSIWNEDRLILYVACATVATGVIAGIFAWLLYREKKSTRHSIKYVRTFYWIVRVMYTLTLTFISCFPLFGMLGTVNGLLGLDLANGDMTNIKNNFFIALTSTAWGIMFSIIFKILNGFASDLIDSQIEWAKKKLDNTKNAR